METTIDMAVRDMTPIFPGRALDINANGQVVGFAFTGKRRRGQQINQTGKHAVLWDNGRITKLFGSPSGDDHSEARAINDRGQIVGTASTSAFSGAFLWQDGQVTRIDRAIPLAINNAGQVVGVILPPFSRAFLWQDDALTRLPFLPGHGLSAALDINNVGQVVGYSQDPQSVITRRAVMWANGAVHDLTAMLPPESGWTLAMATGISDAGHIVGLGVRGEDRKGFVLSPPEWPVLDPI